MAYQRVEVITGVGRRRSWSVEEKLRLVAEASGRRGGIAEVSRRHGVCRSLLFRWRRQIRRCELVAGGPEQPSTASVPVCLVGPPADAPAAAADPVAAAMPRADAAARSGATVEVVLRNGRVVRVAEAIDPETLGRLAAALDDR